MDLECGIAVFQNAAHNSKSDTMSLVRVHFLIMKSTNGHPLFILKVAILKYRGTIEPALRILDASLNVYFSAHTMLSVT